MQVMMKKMERSRCTSSILLFFDGDLGVRMRKRSRSKRFLSQGMQLIHSIYYLSIPQLIFFISSISLKMRTCILYFSNSQAPLSVAFFQNGRWDEERNSQFCLLVVPPAVMAALRVADEHYFLSSCSQSLIPQAAISGLLGNCGLFHFTSALLSVGERIDSCSY